MRRDAATRLRTGIFAVGFGSAIWACRAPSAPRSVSSQCVVTAAVVDLVEKDNACDLEGVLAGYTEDVVWLPPTGDVVRGKAALRERYIELFSTFDVALRAEVVEARGEDRYGFARGYVHGKLTPRNGGDPVVVEDKFLAIARREGNTWRVARLMWSPRGENAGSP